MGCSSGSGSGVFCVFSTSVAAFGSAAVGSARKTGPLLVSTVAKMHNPVMNRQAIIILSDEQAVALSKKKNAQKAVLTKHLWGHMPVLYAETI